jgi:hypothetical protein
MHLKVDVIIFLKMNQIFDFSRLRTTIYNWKNKRSLNSHKRYLSFQKGLFFSSTLLEAPTIPLKLHRARKVAPFIPQKILNEKKTFVIKGSVKKTLKAK